MGEEDKDPGKRHTSHRNRLHVKKLRRTVFQMGLVGLHLVEDGVQRVIVVIAVTGQVVNSATEQTLQIARTSRPPDPIAAVVVARGRAGEIADAKPQFRRAVHGDGGAVDMLSVAHPVTDLGHGTVAFSVGIGVVGIVEMDIFVKQRG